jgi:hypothetical protein
MHDPSREAFPQGHRDHGNVTNIRYSAYCLSFGNVAAGVDGTGKKAYDFSIMGMLIR